MICKNHSSQIFTSEKIMEWKGNESLNSSSGSSGIGSASNSRCSSPIKEGRVFQGFDDLPTLEEISNSTLPELDIDYVNLSN